MSSKSSSPPPPAASSPSSLFRIDDGVINTMYAATLSGMIVRIPLHPIDTCKAKLQVQQQFIHSKNSALPSTTPRSFVEFFRHTLRTEGVRGLYSGFPVAFFGSAPAACIYLTTYESAKYHLAEILPSAVPEFATHFASGILAETASCILWVPVDVVKERLQVQAQLKEMIARNAAAATTPAAASSALPLPPSATTAPPPTLYRGNLDAITTIARTEGLRGVYRAYGATVASFGPFSAIYLSCYEEFKPLVGRMLQQISPSSVKVKPASASSSTSTSSSSSHAPILELPFYGYALSGAAAGGVASVLTNPLDLVKLRMQVQRGNTGFTFGYKNIVHGLQRIVQEEGTRALFKGAAARCLFHIPSTALTIGMFDTFKNYFEKLRGSPKREF